MTLIICSNCELRIFFSFLTSGARWAVSQEVDESSSRALRRRESHFRKAANFSPPLVKFKMKIQNYKHQKFSFFKKYEELIDII